MEETHICTGCDKYHEGEGEESCLHCWKIENELKESNKPLREILISTPNEKITVDYLTYINEASGRINIINTLKSLNKRDKAVFALKLADYANTDISRILGICSKTVARTLEKIEIDDTDDGLHRSIHTPLEPESLP